MLGRCEEALIEEPPVATRRLPQLDACRVHGCLVGLAQSEEDDVHDGLILADEVALVHARVVHGVEGSLEGGERGRRAGEERALYEVLDGRVTHAPLELAKKHPVVTDTCGHLARKGVVRPAGHDAVAPRTRVRVDEELGVVRIERRHSVDKVRLQIPHGIQLRHVLLLRVERVLHVPVVVHIRFVALGLELAQHLPNGVVDNERGGQCRLLLRLQLAQLVEMLVGDTIDEHDERRVHAGEHLTRPHVVAAEPVLARVEGEEDRDNRGEVGRARTQRAHVQRQHDALRSYCDIDIGLSESQEQKIEKNLTREKRTRN